jgi:hypothetical protein
VADKSRKCQHRDSKVVRAYYDANGHPRVKHAYSYCSRPAVAVDVHGLGFCNDHRHEGDYGADNPAVDLDNLLAALRQSRS